MLFLVEGSAGSAAPEIPAGFSVGLAELKALQGPVSDSVKNVEAFLDLSLH